MLHRAEITATHPIGQHLVRHLQQALDAQRLLQRRPHTLQHHGVPGRSSSNLVRLLAGSAAAALPAVPDWYWAGRHICLAGVQRQCHIYQGFEAIQKTPTASLL
jgi:hypothetical protein